MEPPPWSLACCPKEPPVPRYPCAPLVELPLQEMAFPIEIAPDEPQVRPHGHVLANSLVHVRDLGGVEVRFCTRVCVRITAVTAVAGRPDCDARTEARASSWRSLPSAWRRTEGGKASTVGTVE